MYTTNNEEDGHQQIQKWVNNLTDNQYYYSTWNYFKLNKNELRRTNAGQTV